MTNISAIPGEGVVQLYVAAEGSSVPLGRRWPPGGDGRRAVIYPCRGQNLPYNDARSRLDCVEPVAYAATVARHALDPNALWGLKPCYDQQKRKT